MRKTIKIPIKEREKGSEDKRRAQKKWGERNKTLLEKRERKKESIWKEIYGEGNEEEGEGKMERATKRETDKTEYKGGKERKLCLRKRLMEKQKRWKAGKGEPLNGERERENQMENTK